MAQALLDFLRLLEIIDSPGVYISFEYIELCCVCFIGIGPRVKNPTCCSTVESSQTLLALRRD